MYTKVDELPEAFKEMLAAHELLRRLGFSADDIYAYGNDEDGTVGLQLESKGKTFTMALGRFKIDGEQPFQALWGAACKALRENVFGDADLRRMYEASRTWKRMQELASVLRDRGFSFSDAIFMN